MSKFAAILVLLAAGIVAWLYWRQAQPVPFVVSGFVEADDIRVGSRVGGRIAQVTASEGQRVKTGDPLFTPDPFDWQERIVQAQSQLVARQVDHDRLRAGCRPTRR